MSGTPEVPQDLAALRTLLLREDRARLDDIEARLAAMDITAEELAERLPEAIALRARQDKQLGLALAATVEDAIEESFIDERGVDEPLDGGAPVLHRLDPRALQVKLSFVFNPLAAIELQQAVEYYDSLAPGKGLELTRNTICRAFFTTERLAS